MMPRERVREYNRMGLKAGNGFELQIRALPYSRRPMVDQLPTMAVMRYEGFGETTTRQRFRPGR